MAYNLKKLKQENVADEGLVCWGQKKSSAGILFGAVGGAISAASNMVVVCKKANNLLVIPFTNKEIQYKNFIAYKTENINSLSISGLLTKTLTIHTKDGQKHKYTINQGIADLKEIIKKINN